jgi:hypothetical protein
MPTMVLGRKTNKIWEKQLGIFRGVDPHENYKGTKQCDTYSPFLYIINCQCQNTEKDQTEY